MRRKLLAWFRREKRQLPWRGTRDPYRIWVSEVMLQQTTVGAVRARYEAFLARFPDLASLARARQETVLAAWSGLGYYARARHLHEAARAILPRPRRPACRGSRGLRARFRDSASTRRPPWRRWPSARGSPPPTPT